MHPLIPVKKTRPLPPSLRLSSPAKINLFLNVLFKRKDGYHEIKTLFERISLSDELILVPSRSGIKIISDSKKLPKGPNNIAYRAAKFLKDRFGIKKGIVIKIRKRIPIAAGLGGGSSNAASVLLGLNRLWRLRLSKKELLSVGAKLGSDVPFFILETPFAVGRGRGEILRKIQPPGKKIWHCLVKPSFSIATKAAYNNLEKIRLAPPPVSYARNDERSVSRTTQVVGLTPTQSNVRMLFHSIHKGDSKSLSKLLVNSLESTGLSTAPADVPRAKTRGLEGTLNKRVMEILKIKKELMRGGALGCLLSGSGPTVFGIFSSQQTASRAARSLRKNKRWQVFVASSL